MANYKVYFKPSADKELNNLPRQIAKVIISKINLLTNNPRPLGSKNLKGDISNRIRVGKYRVIYEIDDHKKVVMIFRIRHRKDVYK